ncbi:MAG TPA: hypothetical protein PLT70_08505 [bacterium]|nr:hypothetical protein [bacterium]HQN72797.1 hypothetical protein [bacterium]
MKKFLILLFISLFLLSCGDKDQKSQDSGNNDESTDEMTDVDEYVNYEIDEFSDVDNTEDNGDTGNTGNTGNTVDSGDSGNTGNTGDTAGDEDEETPDEDEELEIPSGTIGFETGMPERGIYSKGFTYSVDVMGDLVDLYVPLSNTDKMSTAIYMQGAKVDKGFYSIFAKALSAYGFVVAVPNHKSFTGDNMTENKVFTQVWNYIKQMSGESGSHLFNRVDVAKVTVLGHSFGGVASLGILQNKCEIPTCTGTYNHPEELSAAVLYGTNTKNPYLGGVAEVNTGNIPTVFVQGLLDGKAKYEDMTATFEKTTGSPVSAVKVTGANHYGICDINNPAGAEEDSNIPALDQLTGINIIAKWSGIFMRAHIFGDSDDHDFFYTGTGDTADSVVEIISK